MKILVNFVWKIEDCKNHDLPTMTIHPPARGSKAVSHLIQTKLNP